jgi:hypothetical protein
MTVRVALLEGTALKADWTSVKLPEPSWATTKL